MIRNDCIALVVEGKTDEALIKTFLDVEIIKTNGSDVPRETIEYISALSKSKTIIVLTDPDYPGKRIRDILDSNIDGLFHAYLPKEKCIKNGKVGVAESDKDTILDAINNLIISKKDGTESDVTYSDLINLGLIGSTSSSNMREEFEIKYYLGHTNGKTFLKRIHSLGIKLNTLKEFVDGRK